MVPIVHVFTEDNQLSTRNGLRGFKLLKPRVRRRTTGTAFGGKQLDQNGDRVSLRVRGFGANDRDDRRCDRNRGCKNRRRSHPELAPLSAYLRIAVSQSFTVREATTISAFTSFAIATTIKERKYRSIPRLCSDGKSGRESVGNRGPELGNSPWYLICRRARKTQDKSLTSILFEIAGRKARQPKA